MNKPEPRRSKAALTVRAVVIGGLLAGSAWPPVTRQAIAESPAPPIPETEAIVKRIGFGISRITLHAKAAKRLDIQTGEIREDDSGRRIAPFSSIIYDLDGDAWVYTVTAPLTYVREPVVIEHVSRDHVYLSDGPSAGTQVVTVGVPELYGTEVGVNGE